MKLKLKIILPLILQLLVIIVFIQAYILPKLHQTLEQDFINKHQAILSSLSVGLESLIIKNK